MAVIFLFFHLKKKLETKNTHIIISSLDVLQYYFALSSPIIDPDI